MKRKLTNAYVSSIKTSDSKRLEVRDADTKGLVLRVTKGGSKSWAFLYRRESDRKRRRVTIGNYPAVSLVDARKKAGKLQTEVDDGGDPARKVADRKAELTFSEFADEYIEKHAKRHKRSWAKDRSILDRDVIPMIGDMKISEIGKRDVLDILDEVEGRGALIQANRVFEIVRGAFNFAITRDHVAVNPCSGIKRRTPERSRERVLADAEIKTLWTKLDDAEMDWRTKQIIRLCLVTAQRVGEVSGMVKTELDLESGIWEMPGERTKNGRVHRVPLSTLAVELIRSALERSEDSAFVFPGAHRHAKQDAAITGHAVAKAVNRNQTHFGFEHWTPHDLRRTASSGFGALGYSRLVNDKILNHVTIDRGISGVYDRYDYEAEKRQALDAWADRLNGIVKGKRKQAKVVQLRPHG